MSSQRIGAAHGVVAIGVLAIVAGTDHRAPAGVPEIRMPEAEVVAELVGGIADIDPFEPNIFSGHCPEPEEVSRAVFVGKDDVVVDIGIVAHCLGARDGIAPESIDIAKATLLRREAELDNVLEEMANTTIRAPMAGTVLTRPVEIGTSVASGTSGNTGGTITCTIGDLSKLKVIAQIEETDLGRVKVNGACRITFDSYEGWVWQGLAR